METPNSRRTRAPGRGGQLRGRSANAADEPLLGRLRPSRGQPRHQHGRHIVTSERGRPSADDIGASQRTATTSHAHTRTAATRQSYASPAFADLLERLFAHDARLKTVVVKMLLSVNHSYSVSDRIV